MRFNQNEEHLLQKLDQELNVWYSLQEWSAPQQIAFQRATPAFEAWLDSELIPSLLCGEAAASRCLGSIVSEKDAVLRYTKFLAAYAVWLELDAPANDVAADLKNQGWDLEQLSAHIKLSMLTSNIYSNVSTDLTH